MSTPITVTVTFVDLPGEEVKINATFSPRFSEDSPAVLAALRAIAFLKETAKETRIANEP